MVDTDADAIQRLIVARYSDPPDTTAPEQGTQTVYSMLNRGACRRFADRHVPDDLLDLLCATALASPTKSDLQQRDIILLRSAGQRAALASLVSGQSWVGSAPMIAVFCGNNRRQRLLHEWGGIPFANDHVDAVFNASVDAAIALGAFVTAAEAVGLGCCPISAVRNEAEAVSDLLDLPHHVFPVAGLAIGYPSTPAKISMRLPLRVTCHTDRYHEDGLRVAVETYDASRSETQPYGSQRLPDKFGIAEVYTWSEDKARQYSQPERADFGAYLRARGFCLD